MNSIKKRGLCLALLLLMLFASFADPNILTAKAEGRAITFNNTMSASSNAIILNGKLYFSYSISGFPSITTGALIHSYIDYSLLGIIWTRVDNGLPNKRWEDQTNDYDYSNEHSLQLYNSGYYRVTIEMHVYGSGGAPDVITNIHTVHY